MKIYNTKISVPMKYDRIFHVVPFRCVLVLSLVFIFLSDCHDPRDFLSANEEYTHVYYTRETNGKKKKKPTTTPNELQLWFIDDSVDRNYSDNILSLCEMRFFSHP